MNKLTKKNPRYNPDVLTIIQKQYGFTMNYIRMCLREDRVGTIPDKIKKDYESYCHVSRQAIEGSIRKKERIY